MLRGIHSEYQGGEERGATRTLREGDRVRIVLMMQEGTVVGEAKEADHYVVRVDGVSRAFGIDELLEVMQAQPIAD